MDQYKEKDNCSLQCTWNGCATKIALIALIIFVLLTIIYLFIFFMYIRGHVNKGIKAIENLTSASNILKVVSPKT